MQKPAANQEAEQLYAHRRRHRWQVVVSCLASIVVFVTTYLLILPAITMESIPYCGYEEHIHTDSCYSCALGMSKEAESETNETIENSETSESESDASVTASDNIEETNITDSTNSTSEVSEITESEHTDEITSVTGNGCSHENCKLICGMIEHKHTDSCYKQTHKVLLSVRYEDTMESDWKVTLTANHNAVLSDLLKDVDKLPNGKSASEVKWYNAVNDEEVSIEDAVTKNIELYAVYALEDINIPQEDETKPNEDDAQSTVSDNKQVTDAGNKEQNGETTSSESTTAPEEDKQKKITVDDTFTYKDDNFIVKININGDVVLPEPKEAQPTDTTKADETTESETPTEAVTEAENTTELAESTSNAEQNVESTEPVSDAETDKVTESTTEPVNETQLTSAAEQTAATESVDDSVVSIEADKRHLVPKANGGSDKLTLNIKPMESSDEEYADIAEYAKKTSVADTTLAMEVLQYSLNYGNQELDLSDCKVTAEIIPNKSLKSEAVNMADRAVSDAETGVVITAYEKKSDSKISDIDSIYLTDKTTNGEDTMTVDLNDNTIALYAGSTSNPNFTVEYYAFIDRLDEATSSTDATKTLYIIDTSAGVNGGSPKLPVNGVTPQIKHLYIDNNSNVAMKKGINQTWTKIFESQNCEYIKTPNLNYFNKFYDSANYKLAQVKIQHKVNGKMVWHAFVGDFSKLHFTNRAETAAGTNWSKYNTWISFGGKGKENTTATSISTENNDIYVLIEDRTLIQLACLPTNGTYNNNANFYDYDITDGYIYKSANANGTKFNTSTQKDTDGITWYANTNQQGINNANNYNGSGTKLAFGNNNVNTGLGRLKWDGNLLNMANTTGNGGKASFKECTFGLVSKLDSNGNIVYSKEVNAPNLFDEDGAPIGKTSYKDYSLDFDRTGDTYTLKTVKKGTTNVTGDLTQFIDRYNWNKTRRIWSNLYWPMDTAESFGADGHDLKFGNPTLTEKRKYFNGSANGTWPVIDFYNIDRNAYFGMHYAVNFALTEDYVGPLEYTFFGDDDMWVFLDGKLVCDIGGVHSSVGEYVDLWDYLEKGSTGSHRLDFYFTERGASGSTCWMHFTLPSVSAATPEQNTGDLWVEKDLRGSDTDQEFEFNIHFTDEQGNHLTDDYAYSRYKADGTYIESDIIIWDGGTFKLRGGEYIVVKYLPDKTKYTITENTYNGFNTSVSIDGVITEGNTATGQIDIKHTKQVVVSIINAAGFRLPATGGSGTQFYILSGLLLTATALIYGYRLWRRRERRGGRKERSV